MSSSFLAAMGLPELIMHNLEDYEGPALRLSQNPGELVALRTKLAHNRKTEPLFDTPYFVRNLESAFHQISECFLTGEKPRVIEVIEESK
ncbi:MAG: hypothetical protein ACE5GT_01705 [Rhodospirillales bacterium]